MQGTRSVLGYHQPPSFPPLAGNAPGCADRPWNSKKREQVSPLHVSHPVCQWPPTVADLLGEEIWNVDSVTLPYPLITLQHRIILQNENKQLLPATEPPAQTNNINNVIECYTHKASKTRGAADTVETDRGAKALKDDSFKKIAITSSRRKSIQKLVQKQEEQPGNFRPV